MSRFGTFLDVKRRKAAYRKVSDRVKDYEEVATRRSETHAIEQASRCIGCGVAFCHQTCPLGNYIPEWNLHMTGDQWEDAIRTLHATNNLPEITGKICPAPCEASCVLARNDDPVTVRENELDIIEGAFKRGLVIPRPPKKRTGESVAVVGSGPAGLCCADQLNQAGHRVVVFERDQKPGGLLRYGIPDFKLEKWVIDRRVKLWEAEGIEFKTGVNVGKDITVSKLKREFDAVVLTGGSQVPRDLPVEGRDLEGVYFAMQYLVQSNRRVAGEPIAAEELIDAKDKKVVVIGGGDTGADCVGTAHRQGAAQVIQVELLDKPPEERPAATPWLEFPKMLRTSSSHEEGGDRQWSVLTKKFLGRNGKVQKLSCVKVEFVKNPKPGAAPFQEVPNTAFEIEADLVLLAMGFLHPEPTGLLKKLGVRLDPRGNVQTDGLYATSAKGVFAAGDMRRGQSLVVHAMAEGRRAAHSVDQFLVGHSSLPLI